MLEEKGFEIHAEFYTHAEISSLKYEVDKAGLQHSIRELLIKFPHLTSLLLTRKLKHLVQSYLGRDAS
jgi:hypothetical protein